MRILLGTVAFLLLFATSAAAAPLVGRGFAVVSTQEVVHECSGAGGEHYVFQIDGDTRLAHAGGHAQYLGLLGHTIGLVGKTATPRWFVAELMMAAPVSEDADGNPDSSVAGWCLDRLPRMSGTVLRLVPAADRDAARALLPVLQANGLPREELTLATATKESFALARVTGHAEAGDDRRYELESIDGDVPASFDVSPKAVASGRGHDTFDLWTGDLVVVGTTGSGAARRVTRVLAGDDLAGTRRWLDLARAGQWPPAWMMPGPAAWFFAGTRWAAFGKVVKGKRGCGLEVKITTHAGTAFVLDPMRVAAPVGAKRGDLVAAVVVPNGVDGKDRCGRAAHVVRAYVAPAGAANAGWLIGGEAAPGAALVE